MRAFRQVLGCLTSASALALVPAGASAQQEAAAQGGNDSEASAARDEIVVTGTAQGRKRFDAAYAISTVGEKQLQVYAPLSSADLIQKLPGFGSEPSGGEVGNNINTRGLPSSNFRFVALFEDGLPAFQEAQESFINADQFIRLDLTMDRVEAVRGGTSSIYASNAPGGTINFISKTGTETLEGAVRVTVGDYGLYRLDTAVSGPLAPEWTFAAGGYFRISDGLRKPGFRADEGGQFRIGVTKHFASGGSITLYGKYLNDKNIFYLPIPLADPRNPSVSLSGLIDPSHGTLISNDFRRVTLRTLINGAGATLSKDLADGVHTITRTVGVNIDKDLGEGWSFSNKTRYMTGDITFNALFSTTAPVGADTFAAGQLARARAGFGASVTQLRYVLANRRNADGSRIGFDPSTTGGLVTQAGWWNNETKVSNFLNDLRLSKELETGIGRHVLNVGIYFSAYTFEQIRRQNSLLINVKNRPEAIDLVAVNAAGTIVGSVTEAGFLNYGNSDVGGRVKGSLVALYGSDEWHIGDRLTIDAGFRKQWTQHNGYALARVFRDLGNPATLADDNVGGESGVRLNRTEEYDAFAWTVGVNYAVSDGLAGFARYTKSFRTPSFGGIYTGAAQVAPIITNIKMAELGLKARGSGFSLYATGFWNRFDPLTESFSLPDVNGTPVPTNFISKTETYGVEFEASVKPVSFFEINGNLTLQNPQLKNLVNRATGAPIPSIDGNQIRRFAKILGTVTPTFHLELLDRPLDLYATIYHEGKRFVDTTNATALPAFTTVDAGVIIDLSRRLQLQMIGANLFNSAGLTEGNARVDQLSGQGTPVAIYARPIFGRSVRGMLTYKW